MMKRTHIFVQQDAKNLDVRVRVCHSSDRNQNSLRADEIGVES